MTEKDNTTLSIGLHGRDVPRDAVVDVGAAMLKLLHTVEHELTGEEPQLKWTLGPIRFICDGCEMERPTAQLPLGWIYHEGNDYCPNCRFGGWQ